MASNATSSNDWVLRVGVIGAGGHATDQIYPCLHTLPVRLVAVCDLDEAKASHNAQTYGAEAVYTDHSKMLHDAHIDAVIICVGADEHSKLAIDVLKAGLPVWTEKPPASSALHAHEVLDVSRRTGQVCMTGFMKRFAPVYQKAHSAVEEPDFGTPCLLTINWSFGVPDKSWLKTFLLDFGIHMIDLSRYLFGEVVEVFARERDGISYATTLAFANGAVGTLSMTANRGYDITEETEITGDYGNYIKINSAGRMIRYRGNQVIDWYDRPLALQDSLTDIGYRGELAEFIDAVHECREPRSSIASAYETMRLHDAIRRSAHKQCIVTIRHT